jgi:glycosyltransferase involved in cell wall biosynthesis
MTADSRVSVVISVLNESDIILDCLTPFLQQTRNPFELVLVDNGSTDDTAQRILSLEPAFQQRGIGLDLCSYGHRYYVAARAYGMRRVRGDIIASIDADTVVSPDWIEVIQQSFADPQVVGVGGGIVFRNRGWFFNWLTYHFPFVRRRFGLYTFWGLNCAYRKSAYDAVGGLEGYDTVKEQKRLHTIQDDTYLSRKLERAGKVRFNPELRATALFRIQGREPTHLQLTRRIVKELITMRKIELYFAHEHA